MNKNTKKLFDIGIYVLFLILMIVVMANKSSFHIDEFYSFNLSNHLGRSSLAVDDNIRYEPYKDVFYEYSTVKENNRFNAINVWKNQRDDVHPPLYYWLFNFVCSIFYGSFSKWYPAVINFVSALLCLYFIRKLIKLFTDNNFIYYTISFVYIFTTGILDDTAFFRMYEVGMLWITILTFLFVKQIKEPKGKEFYIPITLATFLSALTHYYCIVYAFFISVVYGIYLIIKKQAKEILYFCLCMVVAAGLALATFPPMIQHMFFGYHGTESIDNIINFSDFGNRILSFFNNTSNEIFGGKWEYVLLLAIVLVMVLIIKKKETKDVIMTEYIMVFLPCFLYFVMVSKIAAYLSERYVSLIHPILLSTTLLLVFTSIEKIISNKYYKIVVVFLSVFLLASGYYYADWFYLFKDTEVINTESKKYTETDCICIHGDFYLETEAIYNSIEFLNYRSLTMLKQDNINNISDYIKSSDVVIKLLKVDNDGEILNKLKELLPQYSNCDYIGSARNGNNYHLY